MQWKPNDNLMFYFDGVYNDQDRKQESSRVQASGVSDLKDVQAPDTFQSVNFGSKLGSINAGLTGVIPVGGRCRSKPAHVNRHKLAPVDKRNV